MSKLDEDNFESVVDLSMAQDYTLDPRKLTYDEVFTFENLYFSAKKCLNGVRWKSSTQLFESNLSAEVNELYRQLKGHNFKSKGFRKFTTCERGKERVILSVHITERVVQKCLCDNYLVPLISPSLIYDNGASIKYKGITFSLKRLRHHLRGYMNKHGADGYIVLFDVKSFFNSIDKEILLNIMRKKIVDDDLYDIYAYFINQFPDDIGLGLGSQVSQISSLIYLNSLDHRMKDVERIKYYGRYMDDGYCLVRTKNEAVTIISILECELKKLNLELNHKKTQIVPLHKEFTYLKRHFSFCGGKIKIRPHKDTINRYRKKKAKLIKTNKIEAAKVIENCFYGYLSQF